MYCAANVRGWSADEHRHQDCSADVQRLPHRHLPGFNQPPQHDLHFTRHLQRRPADEPQQQDRGADLQRLPYRHVSAVCQSPGDELPRGAADVRHWGAHHVRHQDRGTGLRAVPAKHLPGHPLPAPLRVVRRPAHVSARHVHLGRDCRRPPDLLPLRLWPVPRSSRAPRNQLHAPAQLPAARAAP